MSNNVTLPPTGSNGTASPTIETIDTTGNGGPQRQVVTLGDRAGSANDVLGPINDSAPSTDVAAASINGRLQRVAQNLSSLAATLGAALATLTARFPPSLTGAGGLRVGGTTATPSSVLTRPANTTAYAQGEAVASSVSAGAVVVPSFAAGESGSIRRVRLHTTASAGMAAVALKVDFWSAAPTLSAGDGGTYAIATGSAGWLGSATFPGLVQAGDGAYGAAVPDTGSDISFAGLGGDIYWTMQCASAAGFTPASGQTFTLIPEIFQD